MRAEYGSYLQDMNRADAAYLAGELATQIRDSLDSTPSSFALALAEEMKADFSEVDDAVAALKPIVDALFKSWY
ncbi:MAG: hypothetical protein QNJ51_25820 [Calothrix sp. MO_167.B12]|nr:hypothetical protein [Calothrix sp. MO_167.B12]